MKILNEKDSLSSEKDILNRLRRIEGQIKGLQRLVEEKKDCEAVLMQIAAARSAINKVGIIIFKEHFKDCIQKACQENRQEELVDSLTCLMDRYIQ